MSNRKPFNDMKRLGGKGVDVSLRRIRMYPPNLSRSVVLPWAVGQPPSVGGLEDTRLPGNTCLVHRSLSLFHPSCLAPTTTVRLTARSHSPRTPVSDSCPPPAPSPRRRGSTAKSPQDPCSLRRPQPSGPSSHRHGRRTLRTLQGSLPRFFEFCVWKLNSLGRLPEGGASSSSDEKSPETFQSEKTQERVSPRGPETGERSPGTFTSGRVYEEAHADEEDVQPTLKVHFALEVPP